MNENELRLAFRELDRADVELPEHMPLTVETYRAWSSGPRAYLVYRERPDGKAKGIVFHRGAGSVPDAAAMCEWCHAVRSHGGVKLLTTAVDGKRQVGLYLCADLACLSDHRELPGPDDVRETITEEQRTKKILARIGTFAARRLF